jgi:hypothetical protein
MGHAQRGQKHNTQAPEFENHTNGQMNGRGNGQDMGQDNEQDNEQDNSDSGIHDDALEAALLAAIAPANLKSSHFKWQFVRQELHEIRELLGAPPQTLRL